MEEVKKILKNQLDREKESIKRELTLSNLDAIYKITGTLCNIHELECAEMPTVISEASENLIKKYSNGKYDKNVDELYNRYILAKRSIQGERRSGTPGQTDGMRWKIDGRGL